MANDSFIHELRLKTTPQDLKDLDKRLNAARLLYNACLGEGLKRLRLVRQSKTFQKAVNLSPKIKNVKGLMVANKERKTLLKIIAEYLNVNDLTTDWEAISDTKTEILINIFSMLSPFNASEKQALLEAITIKKRSEVLIALSELAIASRNDNKTTFMQ